MSSETYWAEDYAIINAALYRLNAKAYVFGVWFQTFAVPWLLFIICTFPKAMEKTAGRPGFPYFTDCDYMWATIASWTLEMIPNYCLPEVSFLNVYNRWGSLDNFHRVLLTIGYSNVYIVQFCFLHYESLNWLYYHEGVHNFIVLLTLLVVSVYHLIKVCFVGSLALTWVFSLLVPYTKCGHSVIEYVRGNPMIKALEKKVVRSVEKVPSDKLCSICMLELAPGEDLEERQESLQADRVVKLRCRHYFHFSCLQTWLSIANKCPYCRCNVCDETTPLLQPLENSQFV